jgi:hypothetical protein
MFAFLLAKAILLLFSLLVIPILTTLMCMFVSAESACPEPDSYPRLFRVSDNVYDFIFLHRYECLPCDRNYSSDICRDMCQKNVDFSLADPALRKTRDLMHTSILVYLNALGFLIQICLFPGGVASASLPALKTILILGAGVEDKWANLMFSILSHWLSAISDFRSNKTY